MYRYNNIESTSDGYKISGVVFYHVKTEMDKDGPTQIKGINRIEWSLQTSIKCPHTAAWLTDYVQRAQTEKHRGLPNTVRHWNEVKFSLVKRELLEAVPNYTEFEIDEPIWDDTIETGPCIDPLADKERIWHKGIRDGAYKYGQEFGVSSDEVKSILKIFDENGYCKDIIFAIYHQQNEDATKQYLDKIIDHCLELERNA
ncbi:hypothetical protein JCM19236_5658 [Vibrio sp. JCM 19236]|nr:hypothetical protein JCM19236_5658 [Vibrio sp. JCM 19236]